MNESCDTYQCILSQKWDMSHIWKSRVTRMNKSCHTHERIMSHTWMNPVTRANISLTWMSHDTRMNESRHTREWVMSHTWISHVARAKMLFTCKNAVIDESRHTYEWVVSYGNLSRDLNKSCAHINESCHVSHGAHINESLTVTHVYEPCRTYNWATSHSMSMSHIPHMNEPSHTACQNMYMYTSDSMSKNVCVWSDISKSHVHRVKLERHNKYIDTSLLIYTSIYVHICIYIYIYI